MNRPIVLSIGTTHPWNVAGVGRDLLVGEQFGVRVFTAVAAVSAQDGRGVRALQPIAAAALRAQLETLPWNTAGAVRVGALATAENVRAVAAAIAALPALAVVVDPVMAATKGGQLADDAAAYAVRDDLATLPNVVLTPNLGEAAFLLGLEATPARDGIAAAAQTLRERGAGAVLLKGGHLDGDPLDVLATAAGVESFSEPRLRATMPGTGCTLAMALACELANGRPLSHAVNAARAYVRAEIARH